MLVFYTSVNALPAGERQSVLQSHPKKYLPLPTSNIHSHTYYNMYKNESKYLQHILDPPKFIPHFTLL
jgi:hypothetical protein